MVVRMITLINLILFFFWLQFIRWSESVLKWEEKESEI